MPPFVDDPISYTNDLRLIRILRDSNFWHPKENPIRASSGAFYDSTKENSCFLLSRLEKHHFDKIAEHYPESKLAVKTAGHARESGYTVCDDPSDFLPGHVLVCPLPDVRINEYIRMAKRLARLSAIYVPC